MTEQILLAVNTDFLNDALDTLAENSPLCFVCVVVFFILFFMHKSSVKNIRKAYEDASKNAIQSYENSVKILKEAYEKIYNK